MRCAPNKAERFGTANTDWSPIAPGYAQTGREKVQVTVPGATSPVIRFVRSCLTQVPDNLVHQRTYTVTFDSWLKQ